MKRKDYTILLKYYRKSIFRPECNPNFLSIHCIAYLDQNIAPALPYLNAVLGGFEYFKDPPIVIFKVHEKLITVHEDKIAINALKDETEADKILEWLKNEINQAWENRELITPSYQGQPKPQPLEVLKRLPKTICKECGLPTCMVFAVQFLEGVKDISDCPHLDPQAEEKLTQVSDQKNSINNIKLLQV